MIDAELNSLIARLQRVAEFVDMDSVASATVIKKGIAELIKLQAFKDYTHQRLDQLGVPHTVPSPHTDAGCRVGGRFDAVDARILNLVACVRAAKVLRELIWKFYPEQPVKCVAFDRALDKLEGKI